MNMNIRPSIPRLAAVTFVAAGSLMLLPAGASAHARISPPVSVTGKLQLYSLAVPTEKEGLTTTKIVMTVPAGFGIDSFAPSPGWTRKVQQAGSGNSAVVTKVSWSGGRTPTGEDSLFQFLAQPASSATYTFSVQQTYSDGSIVDWSGPESSEAPAPTVEAKESLGGGGVAVLTVVALVVAVLALIAGGFALASRATRDRPLA